MNKPLIIILSACLAGQIHAETKAIEPVFHDNPQPPRYENYPEDAASMPGDRLDNTQVAPNRDITDIPTHEVTISPTRSKTVTRTLSRPTGIPPEPVYISPVITPVITPSYRPHPYR